MTSPQQETVTRLLAGVADGNDANAGELLELVYGELRSLAAAYFRNERAGHTLQPTALVHEAFMHLVGGTEVEWQSRKHFFAIAARAMRNILVNHAVGRGRQKRGGGWQKVALDAADRTPTGLDIVEVIALDEALERLGDLDERKARLVELRFFGGLTSEEAADVLDISRATAAEDWRFARAWLNRELKEA